MSDPPHRPDLGRGPMQRLGSGLGDPATPQDAGTLRIGSIGGVDVMVRSSWLLVAALVAYLVAPGIDRVEPGLGAWRYVAGLAFAVLLTLSLLVHEVSHALVAQRFGLGVRSITLHFIGGVTAIDGEPRSPRQELAVSGVGPVTSLALGGLFLGLLQVTPDGLLHFVVGGLAGANLVVGVLNLVPGFPLDGGRVLRAGVWSLTGDPHRATVVAGWAGRVFAVLMLASPLVLARLGFATSTLDLLLAAVFGWFLWSAASGAIASGRLRARLPALRARELARRAVTVPESVPLAEAVRRAEEARAGAIVTIGPDGRPVGVASEASVEATPHDRRPWLPVGVVSRTLDDGLVLPADIAGEELVRAMHDHPAAEYLLVETDGAVFGVLVSRDVDAAFGARS